MVGAYKLNEEQVAQIKNLFEMTTLNDKEIAILYNVSRAHINLIRKGKRWNPDTRGFITQKEIKMRKKQLEETPQVQENKKQYTIGELFRMILNKII